MRDREVFNNYMATLGEIFDKEFTTVLVGIYWKVLIDIPDDRAVQAFNKAIAGCRFFPRPAELLEMAGESNRFKELLISTQAEDQALLVIRIIQGRANVADVTDKVTRHLLERRFIVNRLRSTMREETEKWFIRDFVEAYKNTSELSQADVLSLDTGNADLKKIADGIG